MNKQKLPQGIVTYMSSRLQEYSRNYIIDNPKDKSNILKGIMSLIYAIEVQVIKKAENLVYCIANIETDVNILNVQIFSINVDEILKFDNSITHNKVTIKFKMDSCNIEFLRFVHNFNKFANGDIYTDLEIFRNYIKKKIR